MSIRETQAVLSAIIGGAQKLLADAQAWLSLSLDKDVLPPQRQLGSSTSAAGRGIALVVVAPFLTLGEDREPERSWLGCRRIGRKHYSEADVPIAVCREVADAIGGSEPRLGHVERPATYNPAFS